MAQKEKILWVVHYDNVNDFIAQAQNAGATGVAIRTDNNMVKAIQRFHDVGIKVFGWRWPSAKRDPAMNEANKVAALLQAGLDGYYVDPEGEPGKSYDWNLPGLDQLAHDFCTTIKSAAPDKILGVTSHYRAKQLFKNLPWKAFFDHADVLLPQSYWRVEGGVVGHGIPADNYQRGIDAWTAAGGTAARIVPMAGEIALVKAAEIAQYALAAEAAGRRELHYYTATGSVSDAVWAAIKAS